MTRIYRLWLCAIPCLLPSALVKAATASVRDEVKGSSPPMAAKTSEQDSIPGNKDKETAAKGNGASLLGLPASSNRQDFLKPFTYYSAFEAKRMATKLLRSPNPEFFISYGSGRSDLRLWDSDPSDDSSVPAGTNQLNKIATLRRNSTANQTLISISNRLAKRLAVGASYAELSSESSKLTDSDGLARNVLIVKTASVAFSPGFDIGIGLDLVTSSFRIDEDQTIFSHTDLQPSLSWKQNDLELNLSWKPSHHSQYVAAAAPGVAGRAFDSHNDWQDTFGYYRLESLAMFPGLPYYFKGAVQFNNNTSQSFGVNIAEPTPAIPNPAPNVKKEYKDSLDVEIGAGRMVDKRYAFELYVAKREAVFSEARFLGRAQDIGHYSYTAGAETIGNPNHRAGLIFRVSQGEIEAKGIKSRWLEKMANFTYAYRF